MNKIIMVFLVFLFGIMAGYGWQNYHHKLLVGDLREEISDNRQRINEMRASVISLQEDIKTEQIVQKIIICESSGKYNARGDGGKSYGPAQFKNATFKWMKVLAGRPEIQWKNPQHQVWLLRWAIGNGYGGHWTCYQNENKKIYW